MIINIYLFWGIFLRDNCDAELCIHRCGLQLSHPCICYEQLNPCFHFLDCSYFQVLPSFPISSRILSSSLSNRLEIKTKTWKPNSNLQDSIESQHFELLQTLDTDVFKLTNFMDNS